MQLGDIVNIEEGVITEHHEMYGNNKQRYNPEYRYVRESGYASMYPLTKDTNLICVFINPNLSIGVYYIPHGEPLFRKYPKRTVGDSFVNIHLECNISVIKRIININELQKDVKVAYLHICSSNLTSMGGMSRYFGPRSDNLASQTHSLDSFALAKVKDIAKDVEDMASLMMIYRRQFSAAMLTHGVARTRGRMVGNFRNSFGNILEGLFAQIGVDPAPQLPPVSDTGRRTEARMSGLRFDEPSSQQYVIHNDAPDAPPIEAPNVTHSDPRGWSNAIIGPDEAPAPPLPVEVPGPSVSERDFVPERVTVSNREYEESYIGVSQEEDEDYEEEEEMEDDDY